MDRNTILKHSKAIRLEHKILPDFIEVVSEFCNIKGHLEHINKLIPLLQQPIIGEQIINLILEYFEREYKLIKLEKLNIINNIFGNMENKQLINIY